MNQDNNFNSQGNNGMSNNMYNQQPTNYTEPSMSTTNYAEVNNAQKEEKKKSNVGLIIVVILN